MATKTWLEQAIDAAGSAIGVWDKHQDTELQREIAEAEAESNSWWDNWNREAGTAPQPGSGTKKPSKPINWTAVSGVVGVLGVVLIALGLFMKSGK